MEQAIRHETGVTILDLNGKVDVSAAPGLRDTLVGLIESDTGRVLVNLSEVPYMDSAGLSVLVAAHRKAQNIGGILGLVNPQQMVQQVFKLTSVDTIFQIFSTMEEGLSALRDS